MALQVRGAKPVLKPFTKRVNLNVSSRGQLFWPFGPRQHGIANKRTYRFPQKIQSKVEALCLWDMAGIINITMLHICADNDKSATK